MTVKTNKDYKYEMRKREEGYDDANSWHTIYYLMVLVDTKPPIVHICWSTTHKSIALRSQSLS
jgi:hypothetical protein